MALPNPSMSFSPFAILTAEEMNNLVENIESLSDGSGFGTGVIPTTAYVDKSITDAKRALSYGFHAYHTSAQNGGNAAFAKTSFTTEEYDIGSNYASSRFTAPINGYYHFTARTGVAAGTRCIVGLFKNGTEKLRGVDHTTGSAINASLVSGMIKLAATDYVEVWTFTNAGGALATVAAETFFQGYCIAAY